MALRQLYYERQHEELVDIIKDYGDLAVDLRLYLGGVEVPLASGDYRIGGDSPAWNLQGEVEGRLPTRMTNAPGRLAASVAGIEFDVLAAKKSLSVPKEDGSFATDVLVATPGSSLGNALGEVVTYQGSTPEQVLWDALTRVYDYERSRIFIPEFGTPVFTYLGADGFADTDSPMSIIQAVQDVIQLQVWDTWDLGAEVIRDPGTGEGLEVDWVYDVDGREVSNFPDPRAASPDEQYTSVVVRDRNEDGSIRIWEEEEVPYFGFDYPPTTPNPLILDWTGADENTSGTDEGARQLAVTTAISLARGQWLGQADVYWNPLLKPGGVVTFAKNTEDNTGFYRRVWRAVITDLTNPFAESFLGTTIGYVAILLTEERLPDPIIVLPGVTPGVVPPRTLPYGNTGGYFWFDPAQMDVGQEFVGRASGRGMWMDPAKSGGLVGHDSRGFWFDL